MQDWNQNGKAALDYDIACIYDFTDDDIGSAKNHIHAPDDHTLSAFSELQALCSEIPVV